jgi:D-tyrosyl-tRNA(Tyr) deacylase
MRAVVQRVSHAEVVVGDETVGAIGSGLLALVGVTHADDSESARELARKIVNLRIFEDDQGRMNRSLVEVGGALCVVSQFTLFGDCRRGRRPGFADAAAPEHAEPLVKEVVEAARTLGVEVSTGRFGATMALTLTNVGPVTLLLDTEKRF